MMLEKTSWSADDFKFCSEIHYYNCQYLKSILERVEEEKRKNVLHDFYYLSGYVIECLLKSYYLTHNHLLESYNLDFLKHRGLKTHSIQHLSQLVQNGDGLNINFDEKSEMFKFWSEQIRYNTNLVLDEGTLMSYFSIEVENVRKMLLNAL